MASSQLIKTVNGVRRHILYYDPDIFQDTIILSASLLIGADDPLFPDITHYNTVDDEDLGINGTDWKQLADIAIAIYPKPKTAKILGPKRVEPSTTREYHIDPTYDTADIFTYEWDIFDGPATITSSAVGRSIDINFNSKGNVTLRVKVSNPAGCYKYMLKTIRAGIVPNELLVVRNSYF